MLPLVEQGVAKVQYNLGLMYGKGKGVKIALASNLRCVNPINSGSYFVYNNEVKIGKVKRCRVPVVISNVDASFIFTKLWFSTDGSGTAN